VTQQETEAYVREALEARAEFYEAQARLAQSDVAVYRVKAERYRALARQVKPLYLVAAHGSDTEIGANYVSVRVP
jgi:hypothetical protein